MFHFILAYFKKLEQLMHPTRKGIFRMNMAVAYTIIRLLQKAAVTSLNIPAFYIWLSAWISSYFLHVIVTMRLFYLQKVSFDPFCVL